MILPVLNVEAVALHSSGVPAGTNRSGPEQWYTGPRLPGTPGFSWDGEDEE